MPVSLRSARRPFMAGIMIGLMLNLCLLDFLKSPAHAQPVLGGNGVAQPINVQPVNPNLQQAKDVYDQLFTTPFVPEGSLYSLNALPDAPGLYDAYNPQNDADCLFEVVSVDVIDWTLADLAADGFSVDELAAMVELNPDMRLIFGRIVSDWGTAEVIGTALEYTAGDPDIVNTGPIFQVQADFQQFMRTPECPDAPVEIVSPDFDGSELVCTGLDWGTQPLLDGDSNNDGTLDALDPLNPDALNAQAANIGTCAAAAVIAYNLCMQAMRQVLKSCLRSVAARTGICLAPCVLICVLPGGWFACPACTARCLIIAAASTAACFLAADALGAACLAALYLALEACGVVPAQILPEVLRSESAPGTNTPDGNVDVIR